MSSAEDIQLVAVHELQMKVAFLEDALSKLSEEYFTQQKELQLMSLKLEALIGKLASVQSASDDNQVITDERPPHY